MLEAMRREATLPQLPLPMTATRYLACPLSISGEGPAAKQSIEQTKDKKNKDGGPASGTSVCVCIYNIRRRLGARAERRMSVGVDR